MSEQESQQGFSEGIADASSVKAYLGNPLLKRSNVKMSFTKEQFDEYVKCAMNPVYFIETYVKIVNVDRGKIPFHMYDFQKKIVETVHENRFTIAKLPRQSGKCLSFDGNIKIRSKLTGQIINTTIGALYDDLKSKSEKLPPL